MASLAQMERELTVERRGRVDRESIVRPDLHLGWGIVLESTVEAVLADVHQIKNFAPGWNSTTGLREEVR